MHSLLCDGKSTKKVFNPLDHQSKIVKRIINQKSKYRGLLLFWKLGTGKTCAAIHIVNTLLSKSNNKYKTVYVFSPGSLRQNFMQEYCNVCGDPKYIDYYKFYSYNYTSISKRLPSSIKNAIIIIDEVHNLINGVRNESVEKQAVYQLIDKSKNSKIIALSGTPIINNLSELYLLSSLLYPNTSVPTTEEEIEIYSSNPKFKRELQHIVSFHQIIDNSKYAKVINMKPDKLQITAFQLIPYEKYRDFERKQSFSKDNETGQLLQNYVSISCVMSRMVANMYYPNFKKKKYHKQVIADYYRDRISFLSLLSLEWSPKFALLFERILANPGEKHVVYSKFVERSGISILTEIANKLQLNTVTFTGKLTDKQKQKILSKYNEAISDYVIFVSEAGIEGINLRAVQNIHILEPLDNLFRENQLIGRTVRHGSHVMLPKSKQKVKVFRYISIVKKGVSSDEIMINRSRKKYKVIDNILNIIQDIK